ncbi:hypothetical protein WJX72_011292 [[Myrmecia] bisecta]|uniref:phosphoribosylaminoimidazole carboxylase n=1 Tax=[Myrmecia] bisecta TaxID=41462 RepID=A0AAW1PVA6_9CHLO
MPAANKHSTAIGDVGLPRAAVVGVLGGGQLGKMLALEAVKMGVKIRVLDPTPECPASSVAEQTLGSFRDPEAVRRFADEVDIMTVEIEHIDAHALETVARECDVDVEPTPRTLRIIQDKLLQKQHFEAEGLPLPGFMAVDDEAGAAEALRRFGLPLMLKSRRLAYDGRGNAVVKTEADLPGAVELLGGYSRGLYAEKWAPFTKELAVMVVRARSGLVKSFPVVETIQRDNICHVTEAPAQIPDAVREQAQRVAESAVACLEGAGVFGVEMFLLEDGSILLNEIAPRPHNSGHYTIEACASSQYEQHLRAVLGWPLGDTRLRVGASIMLNILGEADGEEGMRLAHDLMARAYEVPGASVHWYGKREVAKQRKIGHITITADTTAECRSRLRAIDSRAAKRLEGGSSPSGAGQSSPEPSTGPSLPSAERASSSGQASSSGRPQVAVIMGSDSDLATMSAAAQVLEDFGVPCEVTVVSAHRTPERMLEFARGAHKRGIKVIIAGAGGAAHLPGMVAALTPLPVIGVPVTPKGAHLDGLDALMSIVQMPRGVPVATVAIGNAANAGLLAVRVLGSADPTLLEEMVQYQDTMRETVLSKAQRLEQQGWQSYKH